MEGGFDVVIVGAGPGGLASAVTARAAGLTVLLLNEQKHLGGQIYHSLDAVRAENREILGEDYLYGQKLIADFKKSGAIYISGASVLEVTEKNTICYLKDGETVLVKCKQVVLSTGAIERPVPIPGWTLPGVMGAASVDVLLKQANVLPTGKVCFAGSGPLLLSVACHLLDCGVKIDTIIDTSSPLNYVKAAPHLVGALKKPGLLFKGMGMLVKMRKAGIRFVTGARDIEAVGEDTVRALRFKKNGKVEEVETDLLLLHEGVIPNTQLSRAVGCDHEWYERHRYWRPVVDQWGQSSIEGVSQVGDCTGIFGAKAAEYSGYLTGLNVAYLVGNITEQERNEQGQKHLKARQKDVEIRPFIDTVYPPNLNMIVPGKPQTVVCRCEEVTLRTVHAAIDEGYKTPTTIKNKTRSGMGRCQGRMCGVTIAEVLAKRLSVSPAEVGYYNIRPMLKPATLGELGNMREQENS